MYMTEEQGEKRPRYTRQPVILQSFNLLLIFETNAKIYQRYETNYLPSVISRHLSACSSVVMEPHNSLITCENLLGE